MIDLNKKERAVLNKLGRPKTVVYRQASYFALVRNGEFVEVLDEKICRSLIDKGALVADATNAYGDWIYKADERLFAPNFEIER